MSKNSSKKQKQSMKRLFLIKIIIVSVIMFNGMSLAYQLSVLEYKWLQTRVPGISFIIGWMACWFFFWVMNYIDKEIERWKKKKMNMEKLKMFNSV